jgi:hypothetical protein
MTREVVLSKEVVLALVNNKSVKLTCLNPIRGYFAQLAVAPRCRTCPKARQVLDDRLYRALLVSPALKQEGRQIVDLLQADRLFLPGVGVLDVSPAP